MILAVRATAGGCRIVSGVVRLQRREEITWRHGRASRDAVVNDAEGVVQALRVIGTV